MHRWGVGDASRCGWKGRGDGQCGWDAGGDGQCGWDVGGEAVGYDAEAWQEVTNGRLATSRALEGDPRALQLQTGSQRPASRLADNTE